MINTFLTSLFVLVLMTSLGASAKSSNDEASQNDPITFHSNAVYRDNGYPFSEAVEVNGWIFLSGNLGTVPGTNTLAQGGIEGEARQTMDNIKSALAKLGIGMDRVVKCTVMIEDMAEWPAFNEVYKTYFPSGNYPARSAFGANGLGLNAKLEVECMAKR